jgi:TRAP-type C4-dicarboxylate transport system substrate-binding protein
MATGLRARGRRRALALLAAGSVVAAGCTARAGGGDKAGGGGEAVVLKMANYSTTLEFEPAVADFVKRVGQLSGGSVRIEVFSDWGALGTTPAVEQQVVQDVAADKADLAWVGTRIFDTLGVKSFQALTAPMLIDNYPLEQAVIASDMPGQMLNTLPKLGVTGLAVLADGLRKPIAVKAPLLGPADWRGITFAAFRSDAQAQAIEALGARASDLWGGLLTRALDAGTIQGFEKSLLIYQLLGLKTQAPYVTANVDLWPQTVALLANPGRLAKLTDAQRGWVQQAAQDAAASSTGLVEHEDQIVANLCQAGVRLANASMADLTGLRQAFSPVYATLEQDPETNHFIERIDALKQSTAVDAPLAIPAGCTGSAPGSAPRGPTGNDPIAGSWTTAKLTESQTVRAFVAAGGSEKEGHAFFSRLGGGAQHYALITLVFKDGIFDEYESGDGRPQVNGYEALYKIAPDGTLTLAAPGCAATYRYDLGGDTLRLHVVTQCSGHDGLFNTTLFASFPFTRTS